MECGLLLALYVSAASVTCFLALKIVSQKSLSELNKIQDSLKTEAKVSPWKGDDYRALHRLGNKKLQFNLEIDFHSYPLV